MILLLKLVLGWSLLIIGLSFIISAMIGIFRFPDFYTRAHASSISDSFGIPVFLIGLSFLQPDLTSGLKVILLALIILIICPTSTHALVKSAWVSKLLPLTGASDKNE
ncbi:MAG: putative monovalent cation/proton antiporter, mnhG/phaG subunit [Rickettsiaceae bacterium]|jgi:multicomponent Na+:H+ antiporter subunit G|nr:putative monovalent cation/proton antiporter, mnhG/phaG subunit [Rickettsiaceae bacterium]